MATVRSGRRRALVALLPVGACVRDARPGSGIRASSAAQAAARDWLKLTDAGNATASYGAAGAKYREAMTDEQWTKALASARTPFGAVVQRTYASGQTGKPKGAPDGDYAAVLFRTAFEKKTDAAETVTLEREADGKWRVIGYTIR